MHPYRYRSGGIRIGFRSWQYIHNSKHHYRTSDEASDDNGGELLLSEKYHRVTSLKITAAMTKIPPISPAQMIWTIWSPIDSDWRRLLLGLP